ncbi:hypothetical protein BUALT_Bualt08G0097200 [Buddleja alternifolia]|uniref:Dehydrin n=1 Tax=Buddleja alternifolia TaxID=168488 RepID=A0AAV6X538_9LAMI|nr:hypothetical protein BUALT_Bualt08G0097200 [Buddleja alternifolia]
MADEVKYQHHETKTTDEPCDAAAPKAEEYAAVETTDRGLFDFMGKKKEEKKCEEEVIATEFEQKVQVCEEKKEEPKVEEEKKHEGLKAKLHRSDSSSSSCDDTPTHEPEEKKGFLDKIKDKLPGGKKPEEVAPPPSPPAAECAAVPEAEGKEKKGFLEKIKEKIPGALMMFGWLC